MQLFVCVHTCKKSNNNFLSLPLELAEEYFDSPPEILSTKYLAFLGLYMDAFFGFFCLTS